MGGFVPQIPQNDPNYPLYDPYAVPGPQSWNFPYPNTDPNASMEHIYGQNRNIIGAGAENLNQEAQAQLGYYGPLQQQFTNAQINSLNQLNETPGFTPEESAAITGNPNAPVADLTSNLQKQQGMQNQYGENLSAGVDAYGKNVNQALDVGEGYKQAFGEFNPLDKAVNNPALGFDPNATEKQLSDQDVQDLETQAMTSVGNRYRTAEDTLERQAAAQGNTSPAALAAMRQQLLTQEGSASGDAATNARIAALRAQYGRAAQIEQQREQATQTQAGLQATAATTEEAAKQAAVESTANRNVAAQENISGQRLNAIEEAGRSQLNLGQQQTEDQLRAQQLAEAQGSQRASGIAEQRIAGQGAYRSGVAQQQGMAQQGGQAAMQQQQQTYGTQTGALNEAARGQSGFETGKASLGDSAGKAAASNLSLFAEGGVATEPTIAKIGEKGPEAVIPLGRYKSRRQLEKAA